jgi:signal transduction histidine kinase
MSQEAYAFLGLTAVVAMLVAVLTFAVMRFGAAARDTQRSLRSGGGAEAALLSAALQDAVTRLKTQEKAMSDRAAASEHLSGEIVESLSAGLLVVDSGGRVDILNAAARRMLEIVDPVGGDYHDVLRTAPPLAAVIEECLSTHRPILRRSLKMPVAGRTLHFGVTVSPLGDSKPAGPPESSAPLHGAPDSRASSTPHGVICLFSDLTAVVALEEQLRLKETLARLGELTAGIAHEFRNGLATIHGYSRLIDPQALPAQYRPYVEGIRQETESLGKVVTNFLSFARPEQISLAHIDLDAVVRRAVEDLRHDLPEGASLNVAGEFGEVLGDEVLLRQVLVNLLRNAFEACQEAGIVPAVTVRGDVDLAQGIVRIAVDDNGPGVPPDARERIFQPFFTTRARGTGLGLAIVQKLVVMHNGRVSLGETQGGGASLQILLPLAES